MFTRMLFSEHNLTYLNKRMAADYQSEIIRKPKMSYKSFIIWFLKRNIDEKKFIHYRTTQNWNFETMPVVDPKYF